MKARASRAEPAASPGLGGLCRAKGPGCLAGPLSMPDVIWPWLVANDFHRCYGLIL